VAESFGPDPAVGVWKLNLAKSSFRLVPTPSNIRIAPWENGLKVSADTIDAHGNNIHPSVVYKFDDKDYPLVGTPIADTVSARRINEHTFESNWKIDEKVILTIRFVVSADGRTLTMARIGTDAQERVERDLIVYDRLRPGE
jgi:hypothetical protein